MLILVSHRLQVVAENNIGRGPAGVKKFQTPKNGLSADFNYIFLAIILVFVYIHSGSHMICTIS